MSTIKENLNTVLSQIREAESLSNREKNSVRLLAVSKFHEISEIEQAILQGQIYFGENRVQEAYTKFSELTKKYPDIKLHIIGQLQTNKVKKACEIATCIESVDRLELIKEIEKRASLLNKTIEIYFEYHTGEESKSGFTSYQDLQEAVKYCAEGNCPHIKPCGLMTMAPFTQDKDLIRESFRTLVKVQKQLSTEFPNVLLNELSMGMSGDYKIAIQEGSTQVRVGTAIFGERNYNKQ